MHLCQHVLMSCHRYRLDLNKSARKEKELTKENTSAKITPASGEQRLQPQPTLNHTYKEIMNEESQAEKIAKNGLKDHSKKRENK